MNTFRMKATSQAVLRLHSPNLMVIRRGFLSFHFDNCIIVQLKEIIISRSDV